MKRQAALLATALALAAVQPANAQQFSSPNLGMNVLNVMAGMDPLSQTLREYERRGSGQAQPAAPTAANPAALRYAPSTARRRSNLNGMIANMRRADPAGAAELQRIFATEDFIELAGRGLAPYGLRTDNVADAYAAWWVNAWLAWAGDASDTRPAQARAVSDQAGRALLATPAFVNATDAEKQALAESLIVQAALIGGATERLKTDPSQKAQLRAAMTQAGRSMGLDFSAMRLTPTGFVPNRG